MSRKRPTKAEARWRVNYRYRRMRAVWLDEEAIGDPLGLAGEVRNSGALATLNAGLALCEQVEAPLGG